VIDLHSHILPGLDDGARDLDEALAIAHASVADGVRAIAATPHVRDDYPTSPEEMRASVQELRTALELRRIPLEVLPGGEVALPETVTLGSAVLRAFGLGGNPAVLLVETPYYGWPLAFGQIVMRLLRDGIVPVIAHPERNGDVQADPRLLVPLVESGSLVQLTAASLDGRLGRRARACAQRLLELELVHLLASDAHAPAVRSAGLAAARRAVRDDDLGAWLTEEVPAALVEGRRLPSRPAARPGGGLFSRRRGR
jgi:protein-tyrosine phosphatase